MTRRRISIRARIEIFERHKGICHICNGKVQVGEAWDVSHEIPLELGGADDETNWLVAHRKCHRVHTASVDVPAIAEAKRREAIHIGAKAPPRKKIQSRGFPKSERRKPATAPLTKALPPRRLMDEGQ